MTRWPEAERLARAQIDARVVSRIWRRDVTVWTDGAAGAAAESIRHRLGWLDAPVAMRATPGPEALRRLAAEVRADNIHEACLLGMGGSSLCAEVLRSVFGTAPGHTSVTVLDTTDEATIGAAAGRLDPGRTLFVVASKSGGTVEVASLQRYFWRLLSRRSGRVDAGRHFVAITDPATALAARAAEDGYRSTFLNPPDIGGRFSALSLFGLVPAALMGVDLDRLLSDGALMAAGCREERITNPGLELGAFMGAAALAGRDKLTIVLPPSLRALGLWVEQLVAESTGKDGKGLLPVVDEPLGRPDEYGGDRAFVVLSTEDEAADDVAVDGLLAAGHPVLRLRTRAASLGAEFFRWEFATAIAGAALRVNPFDEPNVKEAKDRTGALLAAFENSGTLPSAAPSASDPNVEAYSGRFHGDSPAAVVRAAVASLRAGDYLAVLSYLTPTSDVHAAIDELRLAVRDRARVATTMGVGPRYLHSTGQYHKGGPNTAVCLMITGEDRTETPIPDTKYSFSVLKKAQAVGDLQALEAHGRRVVRIHLRDAAADHAAVLRRLFQAALR